MRSILLYFILLLPLLAGSQLRQDYLFSSLSSRNGLVSEETVDVQQDEKGFIWIATADGLQRYEGRRLLTFRHIEGDTCSIPNDNIEEMRIDKKNRLWLLFKENKVGYMDPEDLRFHPVPISVPVSIKSTFINQLIVGDEGEVLLLLYRLGVFAFDEGKMEFSLKNAPVQVPKSWNPIYVRKDKAPSVYWVACDSGLVRYDGRRKQMSYRGRNLQNDPLISAVSNMQFITFLLPDHSGRTWLMAHSPSGMVSLLYSIDQKTGQLKEWSSDISAIAKNPKHRVQNITEQSDGTIWVMGSNLLAGLGRGASHFELIESNLPGPFSIRYDAVRDIYEDRENNLWLCTNKGVYRVNPSAQFFHAVGNRRLEEKMPDYPQAVSGFCQTREGDIIVSSLGNGLFRYNEQLQPLPSNFIVGSAKPDESIACMFQQSNGDIWKAGEDGNIYIIHKESGRVDLISFYSGQTIIRQITEDSDGNIWVGTHSGRLAKWDPVARKMVQQQYFKNRIMRLFPDNKGHLWVCVLQNGLFKVDIKDGSVTDTYTTAGPPERRLLSNDVYDMMRYSDSLYIIAAGGLNLMNIYANTISKMPATSELPSNIVSNVIKDKFGYLWVTTHSGLCSVSMTTGVVTNYNERDGVHTSSFTPAASILLADGRIAFGTSHDWMIFDPATVAKNGLLLPPDISLTRVGVMNRWLNPDSLSRLLELELPYDQNSLTLEFSPMTFQSSFGIFYRLENLDEEWQLSRQFHQAVYNYLPPGSYTFKAYCTNADGVPSRNMLEFRVRIKPPFWKTWWFLGILALAGICVLYWLDKIRMQKIRATESIRTRIATSLTEDMSNSLSSINISSELAKAKVDTDTTRTKEYISQISETSSRMVQAMYDMVWSINPRTDTMADTMERMKVFAGEVESLYQINIGFDIDPAVKKLELNMEYRYELLSVFKEAVTNAGKHSGGKLVEVSIRYRRSRLLMMIVDDGKGFVMDNIAMMGRGLSDMRRRAAAINASFYIESEINTGTIVKMEMPV